MGNKSIQELRNEFVRTFADAGIFLTSEDVDIIFNVYKQKVSNILNETDKENTQ